MLLRIVDEERLQPVARPGDDQCPVGGGAVHHHRFHTVELVTRAAAVRAHPHASQRVAVARFVERDRAALGAGRERLELLVEPERPGRQRREDRRREERARERRASHLLLHYDRVDHVEAEPAVRLGYEQPGPAEVDDLAPDLGREAGVVVLRHAPHVFLRRLRRHEREPRCNALSENVKSMVLLVVQRRPKMR